MNARYTPREISAAETYPLRAMVLRPGWAFDRVAMPGDDDASTFHIGAIDPETGAVAAIMTVMHDPYPATGEDAWRIRGMASHPDARGGGAGKAALVFGRDKAWSINRKMIWCNARQVAFGFYERLGFETVGELFEIEGVGPHKVMLIRPD